MPEIAEVKLMMDAIDSLVKDSQLAKITVLGGRYKPYHIINEQGHTVCQVKNPKTGRMISIDPKLYPGGWYQVKMDHLDEFNQWLTTEENVVPCVNVNGKFGWLEIGPWTISITYGLTGGIYFFPSQEVLDTYAKRTGKPITKEKYMENFHIQFDLKNGKSFYFGDVRRFGTVTIAKDQSKLKKKLNKLGHDMLSAKPLTSSEFVALFRQPKFNTQNICKVLMGQEAVSGVGNYIKAEVLYECGISPWACVSDLSDEVLAKLNQSILRVAKEAYEQRGASLYTYSGAAKEQGAFQNLLKVYNRSKDPDGNPIETIHESLSPDGRTTHYCPIKQTIGAHRYVPKPVSPPISPSDKIPLLLKKTITTTIYEEIYVDPNTGSESTKESEDSEETEYEVPPPTAPVKQPIRLKKQD
jgi:DNA-formamidopyrimidine glycosylase